MSSHAFAVPSPPSFLPSHHPHLHRSPPRLISPPPSRKRPRPRPQCSHDHLFPTSPHIRPDLPSPYPAFLPQTIEHALLRAQAATKAFLQAHDDAPAPLLLRVELPMGRSRRFWYRMSPLAISVSESASLALHFAQLFRGLRLTLVLADGADSAQQVAWARSVSLQSAARGESPLHVADVVLVVAAADSRRSHVEAVLEHSPHARAVVLFNCFMDAPLENAALHATDVYVCRALEKCAVLREGAGRPWSVFVEIAVFEYEWVGDRWQSDGGGVASNDWTPVQENVEAFAISRGATRKPGQGYWKTAYAGCEAGFWPFMTIAAEQVLPIDGKALEDEEKAKAEKKGKKGSKRPFGFF